MAGDPGGQQRGRRGHLLRRRTGHASRNGAQKVGVYPRGKRDDRRQDLHRVHERRQEQLPGEPGAVPRASGVRRGRTRGLDGGLHA